MFNLGIKQGPRYFFEPFLSIRELFQSPKIVG